MQRSLEQHYAIKFCTKLGKSGPKTLQLLRTAYGNAVLSSAQVLRWHKEFKDGRDSVEDEQHAGHPLTSRNENNVARVKAVLDRDQRLSVRLIAEEVGLPKTDVHQIITEDLHMRKILFSTIPKKIYAFIPYGISLKTQVTDEISLDVPTDDHNAVDKSQSVILFPKITSSTHATLTSMLERMGQAMHSYSWMST